MTEQLIGARPDGPYRLAYGRTPQELEDNINALFEEWPYWTFVGFWQIGEVMYRELVRMPDPRESLKSPLAIARADPRNMKLN